MLAEVAVVVVVLLVVAAIHDLIARRRGTYRSAQEWRELSDRRKGIGRDLRARRSAGANERRRD